jgi:hypothetical protein
VGRNDRQLFWGQTRQTTVYGGRKMFIGAYCLLRRCRAVALSFSSASTPFTALLLITLLPFPPRRTSRYRKGMILARPSYQGLRG